MEENPILYYGTEEDLYSDIFSCNARRIEHALEVLQLHMRDSNYLKLPPVGMELLDPLGEEVSERTQSHLFELIMHYPFDPPLSEYEKEECTIQLLLRYGNKHIAFQIHMYFGMSGQFEEKINWFVQRVTKEPLLSKTAIDGLAYFAFLCIDGYRVNARCAVAAFSRWPNTPSFREIVDRIRPGLTDTEWPMFDHIPGIQYKTLADIQQFRRVDPDFINDDAVSEVLMSDVSNVLYPEFSDEPNRRFTIYIEADIDNDRLRSFLDKCAREKTIDGETVPYGIMWSCYTITQIRGNFSMAVTFDWKNGCSNRQNGSVLAYKLSEHFSTRVVWANTYCVERGCQWIVKCTLSEGNTIPVMNVERLHDSPLRGRGDDEFNVSSRMSSVRFGWWQGWPQGSFAQKLYREMKRLKRAEREKAIKKYLDAFKKCARKTTGIILSSLEADDEDPGREFSYCYRDDAEKDYVWVISDSIHWPENNQWKRYVKARTPGATVDILHEPKHPGVHYVRMADD